MTSNLNRSENEIIAAWKITGRAAISKSDPAEAAKIWKQLRVLCDEKLKVAPSAIITEYRDAANRRHLDNLNDANL